MAQRHDFGKGIFPQDLLRLCEANHKPLVYPVHIPGSRPTLRTTDPPWEIAGSSYSAKSPVDMIFTLAGKPLPNRVFLPSDVGPDIGYEVVTFVRIRNAVIERGLATLAVFAGSALFTTVFRRLNFANPSTSPYQKATGETYIYSVWHDSLLMPVFLGKQPQTVALVGMHQDGTFLMHALAAMGIPAVRGSSSRGGAEAVRHLVDDYAGKHIVVTPDGPRGPRRELKPGVAYLASRTGKPVVPTAFACRRAWSLGTGWTDLAIPKPWTTVFCIAGEPIVVPPEADKQTLRAHTEQIQHAMDEINTQAAALASENTKSDRASNPAGFNVVEESRTQCRVRTNE